MGDRLYRVPISISSIIYRVFITAFLNVNRYIPKGRPPFNSDEKVATIKRGGKAIIALFAMTITFAVLSHQMLHLPAMWGMMFGLRPP